ncbi:o-methyltransferase domain-containing protein [Hirsutella rhossiliensis]|uniref:O-methyltransferase domain-containing protein n=1 Tax=Hirsutella rhossiliensis TaxID=111463 RepID=A0A9P8ML36_9HYPO|nr:o-methyltransferase domain-containing protein [Hirsutella rhossiliensis]KAH0956977.1 o-methyltransferase domain-containing protein [Hirsutella rhossiliensis]
MSSPLQGATMTFLAEFVRARRILEIGCYTGYSALAWYEGTRKTNAEIISLEADPKMIAASRNTFDKYKKLSGQFDIIFVDANKEGYQNYVQYILDHKLLAPEGLIMCDNVFARGMTISTNANPLLSGESRSYWTENGKALRGFCDFCREDKRIDVLLLPLFDGVTLAKWVPSSRHEIMSSTHDALEDKKAAP